MTKQLEFHQANVTILLRVINGNKSEGLQQIQTGLLLNTDAEWAAMREQIDAQIAKMQQELDNAPGD